jgi:hypothetical protein
VTRPLAAHGSVCGRCQTLEETGATGLEPATSGVTGQFDTRKVNNGGHGMALFMRPFQAVPERLAWLSTAVPGVCCPIAADSSARGGLAGFGFDRLYASRSDGGISHEHAGRDARRE